MVDNSPPPSPTAIGILRPEQVEARKRRNDRYRQKLKERSKAGVECLKEQIGGLLREVRELKQDNVRLAEEVSSLRQLLDRFKEQTQSAINTAMNHISGVIRSEEFMTSTSSPGQPSTAVCPKAESSERPQGVGCDIFDMDGISLDDIDQILF